LMAGRVLYIEDDDAIRELFSETLQESGLTVVEAPLAEHALEALACAVPDVILLDLGMPDGSMSGIEMLVRLRDVKEWARIPVVVLSGFGDVVNPDIMARLNVAHVLSKTAISGDELAHLIVGIVQRRASESGEPVGSSL
jgi:CheY-like chemotaxis protein